MKAAHAVLAAVVTVAIFPTSVAAQDYNHVPGWADTTNHRYKGKGGGEWAAKTELFAKLRAPGPAAQCTLENLSEADGNVIVNQYRRRARKTNEAAALQWAHQRVAMHHRQLKARGTC